MKVKVWMKTLGKVNFQSDLHSLLYDTFEELIISIVSSSPHHSGVVDLHDPRTVTETSQRSIGAQHIGSHHNTAIKLDSKHRRPSGDRCSEKTAFTLQ